MKKLLHLFVILFLFLTTSAQTKKELSVAITKLYTKISYMDQPDFDQDVFAELSYLKRTYHLDSFKLNKNRYIGSLNDYYYKRFYLYSKFLNENAVVTEDCLNDEANGNMHPARKMLFYTLYPNSIKLPKDIVNQIEEYSTIDEFFGPYGSLNTIYFLKKYHNKDLSAAQKIKLDSVEKFLSDFLYIKYIKGTDAKTWSFYKILSLKVLKMNNNELVNNVDISLLVGFLSSGKPFALSETDTNDIALMKRIGGKTAFEYIFNSTMWIFLLELNKN